MYHPIMIQAIRPIDIIVCAIEHIVMIIPETIRSTISHYIFNVNICTAYSSRLTGRNEHH